MKKWMRGIILIVLAIVLAGCSKSEANVDLSNYPEIVQNGEVSPEFYDDVINYISKYSKVYDSVINIHESEETMTTVIASKSYVDEVGDTALYFNQEVKTFEIEPNTDNEKEIASTIEKLNKEQTGYIDELWYKLENSLYDKDTGLSHKREELKTTFEQLKEEIQYDK